MELALIGFVHCWGDTIFSKEIKLTGLFNNQAKCFFSGNILRQKDNIWRTMCLFQYRNVIIEINRIRAVPVPDLNLSYFLLFCYFVMNVHTTKGSLQYNWSNDTTKSYNKNVKKSK